MHDEPSSLTSELCGRGRGGATRPRHLFPPEIEQDQTKVSGTRANTGSTSNVEAF
jgi:hypothetical protein